MQRGRTAGASLCRLASALVAVTVLSACSDPETAQARRIEAMRQAYIDLRTDWLILRDALTEEERRAWDRGRAPDTATETDGRRSIHRLIDAEVFRRLKEAEAEMSRIEVELRKLGWTGVDIESLQHSVKLEDVP